MFEWSMVAPGVAGDEAAALPAIAPWSIPGMVA